MRKVIIIPYDFNNVVASVSHEEAIDMMNDGVPYLYTHNLLFFNFNTLDKGYDVKINKKNGDYIILSELLENDGRYTDRHIRRSHNVLNLLLAGEITFQKDRVFES